MRLIQLLTWAVVASIQANLVAAIVGRGAARCECFDIPACPVNQLAGKSLCSCQNQAELFCWKRNGINVCPSPLPLDCDNLGADGRATNRIVPEATVDSRATASFKPKYTAESGLHCVDLGYCFRPSKAKTTMTITLATGTAVITVPVGLPTQSLAPTPTTTEPVIVFTPEKRKNKREEEVQVKERRGKEAGGEKVGSWWIW